MGNICIHSRFHCKSFVVLFNVALFAPFKSLNTAFTLHTFNTLFSSEKSCSFKNKHFVIRDLQQQKKTIQLISSILIKSLIKNCVSKLRNTWILNYSKIRLQPIWTVWRLYSRSQKTGIAPANLSVVVFWTSDESCTLVFCFINNPSSLLT